MIWDELYKNRFYRKIDYQRLFLREYDFPKTFSLTENQFSRKTYFYTISSRPGPPLAPSWPSCWSTTRACSSNITCSAGIPNGVNVVQ